MMRLRLTGTCVLVLGIFTFTGSALAGNGHGNDNGGATSAAPGNSANAPGQVKKDAPAPAAAPAAETTTTTTTAPDPSAGPTVGVKPANDTSHDTHAAASSSSTKQYGNGQTAGAIAIKHGAPPSTPLHGPGNSQPHKAAPCSGRHEVDVHALKAHASGACGGTPTPHPSPSPSPTPPASGPTSKPTTTSTADAQPRDPAARGSAKPVSKTVVHARSGSASNGVLSATQRTAELPFTGLSLWLAVLGGGMLVAAGLALRRIRTAEAAVQSGHDDPDNAGRNAGSARAALRSRSGR